MVVVVQDLSVQLASSFLRAFLGSLNLHRKRREIRLIALKVTLSILKCNQKHLSLKKIMVGNKKENHSFAMAAGGSIGH